MTYPKISWKIFFRKVLKYQIP